MQKVRVQSLGQEDPLGKEWQLTSVFLPGKSHEQSSLGATVHRVTKDLDMTYWLNNNNFEHFTLLLSGLSPFLMLNYWVPFPLYVMDYFCLATLYFLSLFFFFLAFRTLTMLSLCGFFFPLFGVHLAFWMCRLMFLIKECRVPENSKER